MRYLAALVVAAMAVGAALLPEPSAPTPDAAPESAPPPISICSLVEVADQVTEVAVLSSINGQGRISAFSAGAETSSETFTTGSSGSTSLVGSALSVVGFAGGLIELPSDDTVAGVVVRGESSSASETCLSRAPESAYITGGSTASGARFSLQLINPYAGSAVAELTVTSDSGIESNARFGAVTIPSLSSVTLDMAEIIPGRDRISVEIRPTRGSVFGVGHQRTEGRTAMWTAVESQQDWWLPVPAGANGRELIVSNPLNTEVEYQVDLYGPIEFVEGFEVGLIPPRGEVRIPVIVQDEDGVALRDPVGLRVISTSPVAATLSLDRNAALAMMNGSPVDALSWLLPGAQSPPGGDGQIVIFNNGIESVEAVVRSLGGVGFNRTVVVEAGAVVNLDVVAADGFRVDANGAVVVAWTSSPSSGGRAMALGVPILDG